MVIISPIHLLLIGFEYRIKIENKAETCQGTVPGEESGNNQIYANGQFSKEICERKCDRYDDCKFVAHFETGWCVLYKSCKDLRSTKKPASTFEKVRKGISMVKRSKDSK